MNNAVLDRPVAPSEWVHETRTSGTDLYAEYLALAEPPDVLLQRAGRVARISKTDSAHIVGEQHYFCHGWKTAVSSTVLWQVHPTAFATLTQTITDMQALPQANPGFMQPHRSPALQAARDLREWLHLTYDEIAAVSGLSKRTIYHWQATDAQPRPATVRRLLEIHALVQVMRRKLGSEQFDAWIRTGTPSPLESLQGGDWDAVQKVMYSVLFHQPRRERDFAGYSPYDPETDFPVGTPITLADVEQHYVLDDQARAYVLQFLRAYPSVAKTLADCAALIPSYFPDAPLFLRVIDVSPTLDAPNGRRLVLFIATDLEGEHARAQLDRLMAAWKPDVRTRAGQAFSIDLAYGTTTAAVEMAAERFTRAHNIDWKAHRGLAQRLLSSEPGSVEEGVAQAQLAASLADEGDTATTSGGDALTVLAWLRRQAGKQ